MTQQAKDWRSVDLEYLLGTRTLTGIAEFIADTEGLYSGSEDSRVMLLQLDGLTYWIQEDPSDGYRSYLREIMIVPPRHEVLRRLVPIHPPMKVTFRRVPEAYNIGHDDPADVIYGVNERTGLVVLELGTSYRDDYYPSFVAEWRPTGYDESWLRPTN
jgi:hypothetical protein